MTTTNVELLAEWLAANPAPIHTTEVAAWSARVQSQLGPSALTDLMHLLVSGDDEQQYQATAAARALGAEVWTQDDNTWLVRLPGEHDERRLATRSDSGG
jgi:hypothetical protein